MTAVSKVSIIVVSGALGRLQMAAMLAPVGAVSRHEVRILHHQRTKRRRLKGTAERRRVFNYQCSHRKRH